MKRKRIITSGLLSAQLLRAHEALPSTKAQTGGTYGLPWNVVADGGATFSTGGAYSMGGKIG